MTAGRPPRATVLRAIAAADRSARPPGRRAIDLGCGAGRDTTPLLAAGWQVLAIDREAAALEALEAATPSALRPRLVTRQARLEATSLPAAELIIASFCLFFLDRQAVLQDLVARVAAALVPGGRFAGHLLGPRDSWVAAGRTLGIDCAGLDALFRGFAFEVLQAEENDGVTPRGKAKHWHVWHINAIKRQQPRRNRQGLRLEKLSLLSSPLKSRRILP